MPPAARQSIMWLAVVAEAPAAFASNEESEPRACAASSLPSRPLATAALISAEYGFGPAMKAKVVNGNDKMIRFYSTTFGSNTCPTRASSILQERILGRNRPGSPSARD